MSHPWPSDQQEPSEDTAPATPRPNTPNAELQHMLGHPPFLHSPFNPPYPSPDMQSTTSPPVSRSFSAPHFVSSPLNPALPVPSPFARSRPGSGSGSSHINRLASDDSQYSNAMSPFSSATQGGSMVLWHFPSTESGTLAPPKAFRNSVISTSGDSIISLNGESKYPLGLMTQRAIVPYAYDPADDLNDPADEEDLLHDPNNHKDFKHSFPWRGLLNVGVLTLLTVGILILFILFPVLSYFRDAARRLAIDGNTRINSTGQAVDDLLESRSLLDYADQVPEAIAHEHSMIDPDTPHSAKIRTGFDGFQYDLVFSDEFNQDGRTFYPGDDPYWEAADLWDSEAGDLGRYDPLQVTTRDGHLAITMESVDGSAGNRYRSGMLQSWNRFCFTTGYIEVSVSLPSPDADFQDYWPGVRTVGNLARLGYPATSAGVWPYSYDSCDVGTLPNQTYANHSGPAAVLHSELSKEDYHHELSWLPGQRLSACTCPGEDHPGPSTSIGRGAPEIDVLEDKHTGFGLTVSQTAKFAPFSHDYTYLDDTPEQFTIYDPHITSANSDGSSAQQQTLSALTQVPDDKFRGSSQRFVQFGFEYWSNPADRDEGFITWQSNGVPSVRMGAASVAADDVTGVSQRLISEEPMYIAFNLGISPNWQPIDLAAMQFPATMLVDYVRVYQRQGHHKYGCNPKNRPTADYINAHLEAYTNPNVTRWSSPWPKNKLIADNVNCQDRPLSNTH